MRPTFLNINLKNLIHNLNEIKSFVGQAKVMACVKANAYGHGLIECSKALELAGVDFLGVAFIEEAIELRASGIKTPILALGGISGDQIEEFFNYDIDILASSLSKLEAIDKTANDRKQDARVHLKIDTGMERVGVHYYSKTLPDIFEKIASSKYLKLVGISSHFATSEDPNTKFTERQLNNFLDCLDRFSSLIPGKPLRHISNSGGILSSKDNHLDMVRPGRILYGISAGTHLDHVINLKPCLELLSEVVYFKVVRKGDSVSYGQTWTATEDSRIITVPLGYGDGIPRALSNVGSVIIRGKRFPIVGTICMDQFMVNLGTTGEAYNGDQVTVIGEVGDEKISIVDIANITSMEALEIATHLNNRLPRKYSNT